MENIIKPIALDKIVSELTTERFVRKTNNADKKNNGKKNSWS